MTDAIKIIRREHRAIAAVVHCFDHVLDDVRQHKTKPDVAFFRAVIDYIQDFPDRFHHPKEDDYLFKAVAKRDHRMRRTIHDLKAEHKEGERRIADLRWKLDAFEEQPEENFAAFDAAATDYLDFQRKHIALEEEKIIPSALETLTEEDWQTINQAFEANEDPIFGIRPKEHYDKLFSEIVRLAPAPHGLGTPQPPDKTERQDRHDDEMAPDPRDRRGILSLPWV